MKIAAQAAILVITLGAAAAFAHSGVQNEAVKARMKGMKNIKAHTAVLADMAKGDIEFNRPQARKALDAIAAEAARIPSLFEAPETDPKSEADPAIWSNLEDFKERAELLEKTALDARALSTQAVQAILVDIGGTCKNCHRHYKTD